MGNDQIFKKNQRGSIQALRRRSPSRETNKRVLIVTEGSETEPNYLNGLRQAHGLRRENVVIKCDCGSDPMSLYNFGKKAFETEHRGGSGFDRVYFVFDKDSHVNYDNALDAIKRASKKYPFYPITSVPCFEYWLLLHFQCSTRQYVSMAGQRSACEQLIRELQNFMPDYDKVRQDLYVKIGNRTETAIDNAKKSLRAAESADTDNPTTRMHELVHFLIHEMTMTK